MSASPSEPQDLVLRAGLTHASAVALHGKAVLIIGASGSGKSALALQLMALGAALIADDQCQINAPETPGAPPVVAAPPAISGLIEARGMGLLRATPAPPAPLHVVVDLDQIETDRLPPHRHIRVIGIEIDLVHNIAHTHFPAAILQYIEGGRHA